MKKHGILLFLALAISQPAWPRDGIVRVVTVCQEGLKGDTLVSETFARLSAACTAGMRFPRQRRPGSARDRDMR